MIIVSEYLKKSMALKTLDVAKTNLSVANETIHRIEAFKKDVDEIEKKVRYILDVDNHKNYKIKQEEMTDLSHHNDMGIVLIIDFDTEFDEDYTYSFDRQVKQLRSHFRYDIATWENENSKQMEVWIQIKFNDFLPYPYTNR
jgi:phosphoserine aminotransferase